MVNNGNIPVIMVKGKTLAEVWERSLIKLWEGGIEIKTEYDNPKDPPSKDCTMIMVVEDPMAEPRIHRAFPGGLEDLEIYRQEVLYGIHDSWVDLASPTKWDYTYHERLFHYEVNEKVIDQINSYLIPRISGTPYSRRVQAVTWKTWLDPQVNDPPCLQRIWIRMPRDGNGNLVLNLHSYWRSRDAFKAAFMNLFAISELQKMLAEKISERLKKEVIPGQMVDISDSYHIYGKDFQNPELPQSFQGFLKMYRERDFNERVWTTGFAEPFFEEARQKLKKE